MASPLQLCYITDRQTLARKALDDCVREAIAAGVDLVQIREKDLATRELVRVVESSLVAAQGTRTRIVVNDRLDVALGLGAAGVHLGGQSLPAEAVRRIVDSLGRRDFLIGVSCHSLEDALAAESAGASCLLLGPIFETASKLRYGPPLGIARLAEAARRVQIPLLALGGITVERVKPCLEAGATGVAGISIFQTAPSLTERVRELCAQFKR
jgi:thiamine-phosphate pyrophosphorylase